MQINIVKYRQQSYFGGWILLRNPLTCKKKPNLKNWVNRILLGLRVDIDTPHLTVQVNSVLSHRELKILISLLKQNLPASVETLTVFKKVKKATKKVK